ncbi:hypothetical protein D3C77_478200 [compost metagenome]
MNNQFQPAAADAHLVHKTAVKIDLVYVGDETDTLRIHAIVANGKLASVEMYCHLFEWDGNAKVVQPGILTAVDDTCLTYEGEWGYGDTSDVRFHFLDRPLCNGQEVTRVDVTKGEESRYTYRIVGITDLLK